jgi:uncharacterized protein (TIGR00369 family)
MAKMIDSIDRVLRGGQPAAPIATLLGFRLVFAQPGAAAVEFEATEQHANPMGTLHGGVLCDIADAAMGIAYACTLEEGETFTTLEMKINFLKPVWKARLPGSQEGPDDRLGRVRCDRRESPTGGAGQQHLHDAAR